MNPSPSNRAVTRVREIVQTGAEAALWRESGTLRYGARDALVRVLVAMTPPPPAKKLLSLAQAAVDLDLLERPVERDELNGWLQRNPPESLVLRVVELFDWRDSPTPLDAALLLDLIAAHCPTTLPFAALRFLDGSVASSALIARFAAPLVTSLLMIDPGQRPMEVLDRLPGPALAAYLEAVTDRGETFTTADLWRLLRMAGIAPRAYAKAVATAAATVPAAQPTHLRFTAAPLDAADCRRILEAVRGKPAVFSEACSIIACYGTEEGARALAGMLSDAKLGRIAARWLALMGPAGHTAARVGSDEAERAATADAKRVHELAGEILALPTAPNVLPVLLGGPGVGRLDLSSLRLPDEAPGTAAPFPPVSLAEVQRALATDPVSADLLPPHHWADLLQIVALHPQLADVAWARERALELGLLGRGADRGAVLKAIERFDFGSPIVLNQVRESFLGIFHLLLCGGFDRTLLPHALAVFSETSVTRTLGLVTRHFDKPLEDLQPEGREALALLVRHAEARAAHGVVEDDRGRWPVLAEEADVALSAAPWTLPGAWRDFRLQAELAGATGVTVRCRERVELRLDVPQDRWSQKGLRGPDSGPTAPLEGRVRVDVDTVADGLRFGAGGTLIGNAPRGQAFMGLGDRSGPISIAAVGPAPRLTRVRVTALYSRAAAAELAALVGEGDASSLPKVAATRDAPAAHGLAVVARLGDKPALRTKAKAALVELGEAAAPWQAALGLDTAGKKRRK